MRDELPPFPSATRRAALTIGARCAAALAAIGLWSPAGEAKRRKKKRKKKAPQVIARLVAANMTGAKEFPDPGDPTGTGSASFTIMSNGQICAVFAPQNLAANSVVTLIHIHRGAVGASGPPVVDFSGFLPALSGCVTPSQALLDEIRGNPAGFYANLHTDKFSGGAIRDQLASA
jgi:hypothetical protein